MAAAAAGGLGASGGSAGWRAHFMTLQCRKTNATLQRGARPAEKARETHELQVRG